MTPRHDPLRGRRPAMPPFVARGAIVRAWALRNQRRKPGRHGEPDGEPCPVTPDCPRDLSGGAAAALEFDT